MKVHIYNQQRDLPVKKSQVQKAVREVLAQESKAYDEVTVHFVTRKIITSLHERYFNDPTPTDCISFPMDEEDAFGYRVLGEVFVCPKTAVDYCASHGGDPHHEITLYIIHGLLHLMGYDDLNPSQRKLMRLAEKRHLKHLQELKLLLCNSDNV